MNFERLISISNVGFKFEIQFLIPNDSIPFNEIYLIIFAVFSLSRLDITYSQSTHPKIINIILKCFPRANTCFQNWLILVTQGIIGVMYQDRNL